LERNWNPIEAMGMQLEAIGNNCKEIAKPILKLLERDWKAMQLQSNGNAILMHLESNWNVVGSI
jgi:hypothetical protein